MAKSHFQCKLLTNEKPLKSNRVGVFSDGAMCLTKSVCTMRLVASYVSNRVFAQYVYWLAICLTQSVCTMCLLASRVSVTMCLVATLIASSSATACPA